MNERRIEGMLPGLKVLAEKERKIREGLESSPTNSQVPDQPVRILVPDTLSASDRLGRRPYFVR